MRIATQAVAHAPRDTVMERILDEEALTARVRARGIEVEKIGPDAWIVRHTLMGIRRETRARLVERAPDRLRIETDTKGITSRTEVRLSPDGAGTRIETDTQVEATGIAARLALKALQPARAEIERRVQAGVQTFAADFGG